MAITPTSGEFITLEEAKTFVFDFRKKYPDALKGYFAGCEKISAILAQEGCIGIRMYNGYDCVEDKTNLVIVGVNTAERDMTDGLILERTIACPTDCDHSSPLF